MCLGLVCNACAALRRQGATPLDVCPHGPLERHIALSALEPMAGVDDVDLRFDDAPASKPKRSRVDTRPLPIHAQRIEIDLSDGDSAAAFLELVAKVIRARSRIIVTVE